MEGYKDGGRERAGLEAGGWAELLFLGTGEGRVGLLAGDVVELLRPGFDWLFPIVGREAGRGFS